MVSDKVKNKARLAVHALQRMRLRVVLMTGDNAKTSENIARQVGGCVDGWIDKGMDG